MLGGATGKDGVSLRARHAGTEAPATSHWTPPAPPQVCPGHVPKAGGAGAEEGHPVDKGHLEENGWPR